MENAVIRKSGYHDVDNRMSGIGVHLRPSAVNEVEKTKPIRQPLAGNPKYEYLNPKRFDGCVLKKQSQF